MMKFVIRFASTIRNVLTTLSLAYLASIGIWLMLKLIFADRWWWLFIFNTFAPYFLFPALIILPVGLLLRKRVLAWGGIAAWVLVLALYGQQFLPRSATASAAEETLNVMTYNTLGFNNCPPCIVKNVEKTDADVVALQELNGETANALESALGTRYPYRVFDARDGVYGMGVMSRYPLTPTGITFPGEGWVGEPQILEINVDGTKITLVNVHLISTNTSPSVLEFSARVRENQAQIIADFVKTRTEPLLVAGDFNTTDQSDAYARLARVLKNAWREVGFGLGHTFPSPERSTGSLPMPAWLVRIDHIFYSSQWNAVTANIGPWDITSDHRPVVATLQLIQ